MLKLLAETLIAVVGVVTGIGTASTENARIYTMAL